MNWQWITIYKNYDTLLKSTFIIFCRNNLDVKLSSQQDWKGSQSSRLGINLSTWIDTGLQSIVQFRWPTIEFNPCGLFYDILESSYYEAAQMPGAGVA